MGPRGIFYRDAPEIVKKVHERIGNRLLESESFSEGSSTYVYRTILKSRKNDIPVVLKCWKDEDVLTSMALTVHNNYLALQKMKARSMLSTVLIPVLYRSFLESDDGLLIELPPDKYVTDETNPKIGTVKNQLLLMQDISENGRFELRDRIDAVPEDQKRGLVRDFEVIAKMMGGCMETLFSYLAMTPITTMSKPKRIFIADIDKLRAIPYPGPMNIELATIMRENEASGCQK